MKHGIILTTVACVGLMATQMGHAQTPAPAPNSTPAPSVGSTRPVVPSATRSDLTQLRGSKIIGETVKDGNNQSLGKIDDLIVTGPDKITTAVISVGGVMGVGAKLVSVPVADLRMVKNESGKVDITLPGATKQSLEAMPEFAYAT